MTSTFFNALVVMDVTSRNLVVKRNVTRKSQNKSQNEAKIKMADMNAKYFKVYLIQFKCRHP